MPYRIRAISTDDAGRERAFIGSLSEATLYNRLMYALREPSAQFIRNLVDVDYHESMALVASLPDAAGEPLIAVARYATDAPGSRRAEFAVAVADAWQGRGVGRRLLAELIAYARARGLATLYGSVLATNQPMIELAHSLGMQTNPADGNGQLVDAVLALAPNSQP